MDLLEVYFSVAGIRVNVLFPFSVAFFISFFTSMAGVSGAFLLLPFQMSVLGFTTPSVSATNFLYNLVGIPGGLYRYIKEQRMAWPLACCIAIGTLPGVLVGYVVRMWLLPEPREFKFFVGMVLLLLGYRLIKDILQTPVASVSPKGADFKITDVRWGFSRVSLKFSGEVITFSVPAVVLLSLIVGIIGGIYGIGGGSIIAPFFVSIMGLPVYIVSGAVLLGTFLTSITGLGIYTLVPVKAGMTAPPDWLLGGCMGAGGLLGMYLGARMQKYFPERAIKVILTSVIVIVSLRYILQFFRT